MRDSSLSAGYPRMDTNMHHRPTTTPHHQRHTVEREPEYLLRQRTTARRALVGDDASGDHSTDRRLIFVTNRGPIEHTFDASGAPTAHQGAGGVVSGLLCAARERPVSWISLAMTDADRAVVSGNSKGVLRAPTGLDLLTSRLVAVAPDAYSRYYDSVSNHILWFVQHGMLQSADADAATIQQDWDDGYVPVNRAVASAVITELTTSGAQTPVMFHDYHLYLAPAMVRERMPNARLQHFIHIPWPTLQQWALLPAALVRSIYRGLAANDVLGFQTPRDAQHFLDGAARYLPEASVSHGPDELLWQGRRVQIRAYPIAVTPSVVTDVANACPRQEEVANLLAQARPTPDHKVILRVDRVEPTKNIVRGFDAYERLLEQNPELQGRVTFVALLVPTREGLAQYRAYSEQVHAAIDQVNARFGTATWQPILALFGNDHARALACMQHYDVLLVNPVIDGMNLVVKEGGLLNTRDGVIVLSREAGAHAQLHDCVLGIDPHDVTATSAMLHRALTMPAAERATLAQGLARVLYSEDAGSWLSMQLADLMRVTSTRKRPTPDAAPVLTLAVAGAPRWQDQLAERVRTSLTQIGTGAAALVGSALSTEATGTPRLTSKLHADARPSLRTRLAQSSDALARLTPLEAAESVFHESGTRESHASG